MDDTLVNMKGGLIEALKAKHGIRLSIDYFKEWHGRKTLIKVSDTKSVKLLDPLKDKGFFLNLFILPGAKTALLKMKDNGWRVVIVTSLPRLIYNPGQAIQEKMEWIENNLDGVIESRDLVFTYKKYLVRGDILIDDAVHNINLFPGKVIIFNQPWNRSIQNRIRVHNWKEVIPACNKIFGSGV
jgi:5'(3')-deoxyribonucleotidase